MPRVSFDDLPDSARVWVFPADRSLEEPERTELLSAVDDFLEGWNAHGTPLRGARDLRHDRFLIVGVDEAAAPPSGCSIDALVRVFKQMAPELGVELLDRSPIWFRREERIRSVDRAEFRRLAEKGEVGPGTVVFDPSVTRLEEVRSGKWERRADEGWHETLL